MGIKHWTSTRRGPEALTLKVDRGAWNVGSNNPESTLGISELQPFEVDHDTCKILARALPKMVSLALSSLLNVEGEKIDVRAHYQRVLCARRVVCRLRPGSITTRRQGSGLIVTLGSGQPADVSLKEGVDTRAAPISTRLQGSEPITRSTTTLRSRGQGSPGLGSRKHS